MAITLSYLATTLTLPPDLIWVDEYRWSPVSQQESVTLAGALVVQAMAQITGRPITLQGGKDYAWLDRATIEALRALADTAGTEFTLTLRGVARTVMFTGERLRAETVWPIADPDGDQPYALTLYFREV